MALRKTPPILLSVETKKIYIFKHMIFKNYQSSFRLPVNRHPKTSLLEIL